MSENIIEVIYLVVGVFLTIFIGRFVHRIEKFITLIESVANAFEDMKITPTELAIIVKNFKLFIEGKE